MRIAHYLERFSIAEGGVVRAVLDLAAWTSRNNTVDIITRDDTDVPELWKTGDNQNINMIKLTSPPGPLGTLSKAEREEVRQTIQRADVLHLHTAWNTANLGFATLARQSSTPYVLSIHGMLDDWCMKQSTLKKRVYHTLFARKLFEDAAFVHCTAEAEHTQSAKWYPNGRGRVIPLIFDLTDYRELPDPGIAEQRFNLEPRDQPRIVFLSRIHEKKGLEHLIRAAAILAHEQRHFRLLIAGTGDPPAYAEQMQQLARDEGIADRTRFLGLVTGDTKLSLLNAADMLVLPTSQENFGFVIPEALACGIPVITTKGVDIWPELENSGAAVISSQKPNEIAEAVRPLLDNPQQAASMGTKGRTWVFQHLDPEQTTRQFVDMYDSALAANRNTLKPD